LQQVASGYRCSLSTKGRIKEFIARVVVAAHGSWEPSALLMNRRRHGPTDLLAFKAHLEDCVLPPDLMPLLVFPGGYGGMVHTDNGRVTLSCCVRRDELQRSRRAYPQLGAGAAVFEHIRKSCAAVCDATKYARVIGGWLSAGPIRPGFHSQLANGIFRIGNAAGEAHPIIAEGISMAMQSAWLLSRQLIAEQDDILGKRSNVKSGRRYHNEWKNCFAARIRAASVFARVMLEPRAVSLIMPLLELCPRTLTFAAQLSGKTNYIVASRGRSQPAQAHSVS
jgi:flavin-dependent dehydrogenase